MVGHSCNLKDNICFHVYTLILVRYVYSKGKVPKIRCGTSRLSKAYNFLNLVNKVKFYLE